MHMICVKKSVYVDSGQCRLSLSPEGKMLGLSNGDEIIISIRTPRELPEGGYWGGDVVGLMEAGFSMRSDELGIRIAMHPCFADDGVRNKIIAAHLDDKIVNGVLYKKDVWHDDIDVSLNVIYKYKWVLEPMNFAGELFQGVIVGNDAGDSTVVTPYNRLDAKTARMINDIVLNAIKKEKKPSRKAGIIIDEDLAEMVAEAHSKIDMEQGQAVLSDMVSDDDDDNDDDGDGDERGQRFPGARETWHQ